MSQRSLRLTATPFTDLIDPKLFKCDLCTAVITNPQQHFRVHEAEMWVNAMSDIFTPFLFETGEPETDEQPKGESSV